MQLTKFARGIFSLAAVMPLFSTLLINCALIQYSCDLIKMGYLIVFSIIIFCGAVLLLRFYIRLNFSKEPCNEKFESISLIRSNPIVFVLVYLLPIITSQSLSLFQSILFGAILFFCLFVVHTVALSPILNLLGYRIYKISNSKNCEFVLLSKRDISSITKEIEYYKIDPFTFVEKERRNATVCTSKTRK